MWFSGYQYTTVVVITNTQAGIYLFKVRMETPQAGIYLFKVRMETPK